MASFEEMKETLKRASAILREADIPFALGGGFACWARGGAESEHDLDLVMKPEDAERALRLLAEAGMRPEIPPEGWLYKAWDGDVMVDLIFALRGRIVTDDLLERADELEVNAVPMRVMTLEDVLVTKLLSLGEHELDYESVLEIGRTLREQIDWGAIFERTRQSPYALAYFTLVEELGIAPRRVFARDTPQGA
jgi:Uncharacterised nucleotidyltransferase